MKHLVFRLVDCDCTADTKYADDSSPYFFTDEVKAARKFIACTQFMDLLYVGVHLNNKHIMGVSMDKGRSVYGHMGKQYVPIVRKKRYN